MTSRPACAGQCSPTRPGPAAFERADVAGRRARFGRARLAVRYVAVLAGVLVLLAPLACAEGPGDGADGVLEEPTYGGTVVVAGPNDLDAANGLVTAEKYTLSLLRFALFMPLVRYDENLDYEPYLARSVEMQGDTAAVFHLRDDVRWHDGVPTTAEDVAFTFRRAKDPATAFPSASYYEQWTSAEVVDSFTVRFRFEPHPEPLAGLPFTPIMPKHLLEDVPPAELRQAEFNRAPVGNGPFRFVRYRANDRWVFEANPDFPEELGGRPFVDRLVWRVIPENSAQVTEVLTGSVDLVLSPPVTEIDALDADPSVRAVVKPGRQYAFIGWNGKRAPFDDPRVRRALSMAIDRHEILDVLRAGYGTLAVGPVGPYHWAYDDSLEPLPFDADAARSLLGEAGLRDRDGDGLLETDDGEDFVFDLMVPASNAFNRDVAELVRADLDSVGVGMNIRQTEATTMFQAVSSPERPFDAALLAWEADFRLNLHDIFHSDAIDGPFQLASYSNREVDDLLDRAAMTLDRDAARPLWHRVQAILREEQPWAFLYYFPDVFAMRERVRGVEMDIRGTFVNVSDWWIAPSE